MVATNLPAMASGKPTAQLTPTKILSLCVTDKEGRILIRCQGGCSQEPVLTALKSKGLWPGKNGSAKRDIFSRLIAATYDYLDEAGKLLFQVVRTDPKDFYRRRPNPCDLEKRTDESEGG